MIVKTVKGYNLYTIASALQKSIRRGDAKLACYCALELFHSGFYFYLWKRLLVVSAEDVYASITKDIWALYQSFLLIREKEKKPTKGRIFISKAVLSLCRAQKCRDADHVSNLLYDLEEIPESEIETYAKDYDEKIEMPNYVYDCHTIEGKRKGKTKQNFFQEEFFALSPHTKGEFDSLILDNQ